MLKKFVDVQFSWRRPVKTFKGSEYFPPFFTLHSIELYINFVTVELIIARHGGMDGRIFEIEFEVDDVEVKLMHGYKIGNAWEGIGVQP